MKGIAVPTMRANKAFTQLLARLNVDISSPGLGPSAKTIPALTRVDGSIFLVAEHLKSKSVSLEDFPDRTGLECFVNHVHLPFRGDKDSLVEALAYIEGLQRSLLSLESDEDFVIILSLSETSSVIRFHKRREDETWLAADIDGYEEPVGVFDLRQEHQ